MMYRKKLLLIIPQYFGYEKKIEEELITLGYEVDVIFENIEELYYKYRLISRRFPRYKNLVFKNYYLKTIKDKKYDVILAIRASSLVESVIEFIKGNLPQARLYMYQWDSVKNNKNAEDIAKYFDKVSTFDIKDAKEYGWNYRPLFYINETQRSERRIYDISFIASLHSQRLKIFSKLNNIQGIKKYLYLFSKRSHYYKQKYLVRNSEFMGVSDSYVNFTSLSLDETNNVMADSNIIVDYTHPDQTGFTMRTCESIGHRCKLVTNNKMARKADFYSPTNVWIYENDKFDIPKEFLESEYEMLEEQIYIRYSIKEWIKEVLDL